MAQLLCLVINDFGFKNQDSFHHYRQGVSNATELKISNLYNKCLKCIAWSFDQRAKDARGEINDGIKSGMIDWWNVRYMYILHDVLGLLRSCIPWSPDNHSHAKCRSWEYDRVVSWWPRSCRVSEIMTMEFHKAFTLLKDYFMAWTLGLNFSQALTICARLPLSFEKIYNRDIGGWYRMQRNIVMVKKLRFW